MIRNVSSLLFIVLASGAMLSLFHYFAPLQPASVAVYAGVVLTLCGLVCVIKPLRLLCIHTRRAAAMVASLGVVVFLVALSWPVGQHGLRSAPARWMMFCPNTAFRSGMKCVSTRVPKSLPPH